MAASVVHPYGKQLNAFPHLQKETALLRQGYCFVAGLDEAGRGAWAGPVVAAAVILPPDHPDLAGALLGLQDSKKLTPKKREELFSVINATALAVAVGQASAQLVDDINVIGATRYAMRQALAGLKITPNFLLLDYLKLPTVAIPQEAFAKADNISLTVAAASVIAKVTRDRFMAAYSQTYPGYGFERHKGYGTKAHRAALKQHGPCPLHRMSYRPLQPFAAN